MSRWYGVAREPPETAGRPCDGGSEPVRPHGGSSGFTMVEILVAMVVTGIVGAGIVQLLLSQNEFYSTIDDRAFTEHSLRASAELLNRELRAVAPEDIVSADAGQLTVYQDSLRAVVCESSDPVYAYVYHRVSSPRLESGTIGAYYRNVETGSYEYLPSFEPSFSGYHPVTECENNGAPEGRPDEYYMSWDWSTSPGPPPDGAVIRIFGQVTYSIEPSDFGEGHALWRNGEELVGPFTSESEFRYRMDDGTETTSPGTLSNIRSVIVDGRLRESERSRGETRRALNLDITLRNRVGS